MPGKMIFKKNENLILKHMRAEQRKIDWLISEVKDLYGIEEDSDDDWGFAQTRLLSREEAERISSVRVIEPVIIESEPIPPSLFELSGEL